jgi:multicomponent K+:H+ antiporter subunit E
VIRIRALPHPIASACVFLVWLGLNEGPGLLHVVSGVALAVAVPWLVGPLLDDRVSLHRPALVLHLAGLVVWDIVVANVAVARRVLGRLSRLRPAFVPVPVDLAHPDAVALLASIIAITPGTVVIDIDDARTRILIHVLDVDDPSQLVAQIKQRYEQRLKEIFGC